MSEEIKRTYRKHTELYLLLNKIKLWPSRTGILHGIRTLEKKGDFLEITTHCGKHFRVYNSSNSRAARWLRNKWVSDSCKECRVPGWKLQKYSQTGFSAHYGSDLKKPTL